MIFFDYDMGRMMAFFFAGIPFIAGSLSLLWPRGSSEEIDSGQNRGQRFLIGSLRGLGIGVVLFFVFLFGCSSQ